MSDPPDVPRHGSLLWLDVSAGVAGDMLLAALLDAGAGQAAVEAAISVVVPGEVELRRSEVTRAGLRACKVDVVSTAAEHPHRSWADVRGLLAGLDPPVRDRAVAVFGRLADAEARVHGIGVDDVWFHEVGAWDSIADVVGVAAALHDLGVADVVSGPLALGSGHVRTAHGDLPVPVPAVLELARGRDVVAGGDGELATPTGTAALAALAGTGPLPAMRVEAVGVGAGSRDVEGRANVVRAVLGSPGTSLRSMWVLETNVDDLDPRVWPGVLAALLDRGAADAWLTPILMKKGRPAHTLSVLADGEHRTVLRDAVVELTTTLGVRETAVTRHALDREWRTVALDGGSVRIKLGLRDGRIVQVTPEFADVERLAADRGAPVHRVLREAQDAATTHGLRPGLAAGEEADS